MTTPEDGYKGTNTTQGMKGVEKKAKSKRKTAKAIGWRNMHYWIRFKVEGFGREGGQNLNLQPSALAESAVAKVEG